MDKLTKKWESEAKRLLEGRTIKGVRYLTIEEQDEMYWHRRGLVLFLDNGDQVIVSQDDEGNGPGALHVNGEDTSQILPVL
jgi:uncharacterized protein Smg (DUF494 family)